MSFPSLRLTNAGRQLIIKALSENCAIPFTRFGLGNGSSPANINTISNLNNMVKSISISEMTAENGYATLIGVLENTDVTDGFWWSEIGIFATDPDVGEVLYAYAHAGEYADYIPPYSSTSYLRTIVNAKVVVDNAQNITIETDGSVIYASKQELNAHKSDTTNPHMVTAAQIGAAEENHIHPGLLIANISYDLRGAFRDCVSEVTAYKIRDLNMAYIYMHLYAYTDIDLDNFGRDILVFYDIAPIYNEVHLFSTNNNFDFFVGQTQGYGSAVKVYNKDLSSRIIPSDTNVYVSGFFEYTDVSV